VNKNEIEVGNTYLAKTGGKQVEVRIERVIARGGWSATNLVNGRPVRIRDAKDLRPIKRKVEAAAVTTYDEAAMETPTVASDAANPAFAATAANNAVEAPAVADTATPDAVDAATADKPPVLVQGAPKVVKKLTRKKAADAKSEKGMSCLDAAAEVLKAEGRPLTCKTLIEIMAGRNLWTTAAPTPSATLHNALMREIVKKGPASRFRKSDRGLFELARK
jgi:hypothetical protein